MRRGDLVTVALQGDYGKPRPALVIQSDLFDGHPSVTILPITSELVEAPLFRLSVDPTPGNGLRKRSQVMVDKVQTIARDKTGEPFGRLEDDSMLAVNRAFLLWIGLA
ncbi:mRNA interferase MazF [Azospirillum lipoferum]|uniref:Type II toxin-antitoxin system PemK/MazF family toxin n=1 Tax=Azospirillum lipoferum TaxID=193 RepID=A0A5A9GH64_AZOLI|nr:MULTISPECIES: type II toxin-antitoxin system PemK/MazF family toxin [Azospirillum]KAA0593771.1 type II toxin-antitoxin system PemK/MazF family toxin [Azospirillum lipoferum]MCP1614180.1 mRNA interferase MazF [Azospirillum lipoferum]MDW5536865.1 type II toxin-antitoxin system PemK/MazF family toxin [Azospirillum sp. NL1]